MDKAARAIFEERGGKSIGAGTKLDGNGAGERDVEYEIADDRAEECRAALKRAGFRLSPTPHGPMEELGTKDETPRLH